MPRQATKFNSHSSFPFFCTGPRQADNTAKRTWAKMAVQAGWVAAGPFVRLNQGKTEPKKTRKHGFCSLTLKEELSFQGEHGCLRAIRKKQAKSGEKPQTMEKLGDTWGNVFVISQRKKKMRKIALFQLLNCFMGDFPKRFVFSSE